jgi:hypothetical protein
MQYSLERNLHLAGIFAGVDAHNMAFPYKSLPYRLVQIELSWMVTLAFNSFCETDQPLKWILFKKSRQESKLNAATK